MAAPSVPSYYQAPGSDSPAFRLPTVAWPTAVQGMSDAPSGEPTVIPVAPPVRASSRWEIALAEIAERAGVDPRFVESTIAATSGAAPKPAEHAWQAPEPASPTWPAPSHPTPVTPAAIWAQPPDNLMTGESTVYSAPGLAASATIEPEPPATVVQPFVPASPQIELPELPQPELPQPELPQPELPQPELPKPVHSTVPASPVISIGMPTDETATMQFERPLFDKPVSVQPVIEPVSRPVVVIEPDDPSLAGKLEPVSRALDDFFGPVPEELVQPDEESEETTSIIRVSSREKDEKPRAASTSKPEGKAESKPEGKADAGKKNHDAKDDAVAQPKDKQTTKRKSRLPGPAQWAIEIAIWVVAALILSTLIRLFVVQLFVVPSGSMENTLLTGDRIAALKYAQFERGDIVVFEDPGGWLQEAPPSVSGVHRFLEKIGLLASTDQQYLVKRVVGLPGDRVACCSNGHLTVNGVPIDESSYLKDPTQAASAFQFDVTVPIGRIFVLGDNRGSSADSRWHLCEANDKGLGMNAFVPIQDVVGPVRAVVLPFSHMGHRATPESVFAQVPSGADPPPSVAKVTVGAGGPNGVCHSDS